MASWAEKFVEGILGPHAKTEKPKVKVGATVYASTNTPPQHDAKPAPVPKRPPTTAELLERSGKPDHPSQDQFAPLNNGRMLTTCTQNGYTFRGYPNELGRPRGSRFRAEQGMKRLSNGK